MFHIQHEFIKASGRKSEIQQKPESCLRLFPGSFSSGLSERIIHLKEAICLVESGPSFHPFCSLLLRLLEFIEMLPHTGKTMCPGA